MLIRSTLLLFRTESCKLRSLTQWPASESWRDHFKLLLWRRWRGTGERSNASRRLLFPSTKLVVRAITLVRFFTSSLLTLALEHGNFVKISKEKSTLASTAAGRSGKSFLVNLLLGAATCAFRRVHFFNNFPTCVEYFESGELSVAWLIPTRFPAAEPTGQ